MPLTTLTGEKEVMALLRTIPNVTWQEGSYLEDGYSPEANEDGLFEPYALVEFGGSSSLQTTDSPDPAGIPSGQPSRSTWRHRSTRWRDR